jgi:hypothetical protein
MEGLQFGAFTHQLGIKAAVLCVAFIDRLTTDQVTATADDMAQWQHFPARLAVEHIKREMRARGTGP